MSVTLLQGDCLDLLPTLADASIDAIVTDPPYGIGYKSAWRTCINGQPRKHQASFGADKFNSAWLADAFRVLKSDACLYLFTRWDVTHKWKTAIEAAGFTVVQRLVWDKRHWKMGDLRYYGSQLEDILFCRKGKPLMRYDKRRGNLLAYSSAFLPEGQYDHPTQKPERLLAQFILDSTLRGATILDPFMGSGSTGTACVATERAFIGMELRADYYRIASERIAAAQAAYQPALLEVPA